MLKIKLEKVSQAQQTDDLTKDIHQGYPTRERAWDLYIFCFHPQSNYNYNYITCNYKHN